MDSRDNEAMVAARRKFLSACGKFAALTPPAVALMLAAEKKSYARVFSGGRIERMLRGHHGPGGGSGGGGYGGGGRGPG